MTEKIQQQQPGTLPWVQFRENMLTARETHHKAAINAVRRFVGRPRRPEAPRPVPRKELGKSAS
jgi:hypothetical protein